MNIFTNLWGLLRRPGHGISVIVPFHAAGVSNRRLVNWVWLQKYWEHHLPGAEFVMGTDTDVPFSKSVAINSAKARSHGDVLVLVDADCYIQADIVLDCVKKIRQARKKNQKLWFVPYRKFYRTTKEAANKILDSKPSDGLLPETPEDETDIQRGHWFGAGIQILPREAFEAVGGWDPRFRGWGGEDHAFMRAVDTLWWRHKTTANAVYHLWHPTLGPNLRDRMWEGQTDPHHNGQLSYTYSVTYGNPEKMRQLVNDGLKLVPNTRRHRHHHHHHHKSV